MSNLTWKKCATAGCLIAHGSTNTYYIFSMAWDYLEIVKPHISGVVIIKHDAFSCIDDAKQAAENVESEINE